MSNSFGVLFRSFLLLLPLHKVIPHFFKLFSLITPLCDAFGPFLHVLFHGLEVRIVGGQDLVVLLPLFEFFVWIFIVKVVPLRIADFVLVLNNLLGLLPIFPVAAFDLACWLFLFVLVHFSHQKVIPLFVGDHLARTTDALLRVLELLQFARWAVQKLSVFFYPISFSLYQWFWFLRDNVVIAVCERFFGTFGWFIFPE